MDALVDALVIEVCFSQVSTADNTASQRQKAAAQELGGQTGRRSGAQPAATQPDSGTAGAADGSSAGAQGVARQQAYLRNGEQSAATMGNAG